MHNLADSVAKGGGFMVGVGPSAHGEFHPEAIRQMKGAGAWLKVNGEAIYATRAREGTLWSEGDDVRYTRTKDRRFVYAILTEWPGAQVTLKTVRPREGSRVTLLGAKTELQWKFDSAAGTTIILAGESSASLEPPLRPRLDPEDRTSGRIAGSASHPPAHSIRVPHPCDCFYRKGGKPGFFGACTKRSPFRWEPKSFVSLHDFSFPLS